MKIDYFKINGFGKVSNKEVKLEDNINIIYGKNESGKSTILKFISSMFYGASKNKNGKDISDFDKYNPWNTDEFSGKIKYTLDNKETFEVFREFKKKSPIIYNSNMQDISKEFKADKAKGIDFFTEQTGIDEETFLTTAIIEQEGVRLSKSAQNGIVQKISNVVSSGDENVSFKKTMDKINKEQTEKIGSERTSQRPLNIVNERLDKLKKEQAELINSSSKMNEYLQKNEEVENSLKVEENRLLLLKALKENVDKNKIKDAEINVNKEVIGDYEEKISELSNKIDFGTRKNIENEKKSNKLYYILILLFVLLTIVFLFINVIVSGITGVFAIITIIICYFSKSKFNKNKKEKLKELDDLEEKIKHEIEILKRNQEEQQMQIVEKQEKYNIDISNEKENIRKVYANLVDKEFIDMAIDMDLSELIVAIPNKETRINSLRYSLQANQLELNTLTEKNNNLADIEEEIIKLEEEKEELLKLNNSFNIAKECMELAYDKIRNNVSPKFIENLSEIISKISNGKYSKINFNDEDGLTVETENGNYILAERLSTGTIDQMYLSLRLSTLSEVSNEKMPIILDETFAYFDNSRLENILEYIHENFKENQIIIFTCSNREVEAMNSLKIPYNLITLEK